MWEASYFYLPNSPCLSSSGKCKAMWFYLLTPKPTQSWNPRSLEPVPFKQGLLFRITQGDSSYGILICRMSRNLKIHLIAFFNIFPTSAQPIFWTPPNSQSWDEPKSQSSSLFLPPLPMMSHEVFAFPKTRALSFSPTCDLWAIETPEGWAGRGCCGLGGCPCCTSHHLSPTRPFRMEWPTFHLSS